MAYIPPSIIDPTPAPPEKWLEWFEDIYDQAKADALAEFVAPSGGLIGRSIAEPGVDIIPTASVQTQTDNMNALIDAINTEGDIGGSPANTIWWIPPTPKIAGVAKPYLFNAKFDKIVKPNFHFWALGRGATVFKAQAGHTGQFWDIGNPDDSVVASVKDWSIQGMTYDCTSVVGSLVPEDNVFKLYNTRRYLIDKIGLANVAGIVTTGGQNIAKGTFNTTVAIGTGVGDPASARVTFRVTSTNGFMGQAADDADPFALGRLENWLLVSGTETMRITDASQVSATEWDLTAYRGIAGGSGTGVDGSTRMAHTAGSTWQIAGAGREWNCAEGRVHDVKGSYANVGGKWLHQRLCSGNNEFHNIKLGNPVDTGIGILFESWKRAPGGLEDTQLENVSMWGGSIPPSNDGPLVSVQFNTTHGDIHNAYLSRCDWDQAGQENPPGSGTYVGATVQFVSTDGKVTNDATPPATIWGDGDAWADYDLRGAYLDRCFFGSAFTARGGTISNQGRGQIKDVQIMGAHGTMRNGKFFETYPSQNGGVVYGIEIGGGTEIRAVTGIHHPSVFRMAHGGDFHLGEIDVRIWNAEDGDVDIDYLLEIVHPFSDDYTVGSSITAPGLNLGWIKHPDYASWSHSQQRRYVSHPGADVVNITVVAADAGVLKIPPGAKFVNLLADSGTFRSITSIIGGAGIVTLRPGGVQSIGGPAIHLESAFTGGIGGLRTLTVGSHTGNTWYETGRGMNT